MGCDGDVASADGDVGVGFDAFAVLAVDGGADGAAFDEYLSVVFFGGVGGDVIVEGHVFDLYAVTQSVGVDVDAAAVHLEVLAAVYGIALCAQDIDGACAFLELQVFFGGDAVACVGGDVEGAVAFDFEVSFAVEAAFLES